MTRAQRMQQAIDEIQKQLGHHPTPREVVDLARDPKSPLHDEFDWDDSVAADKWRLQQAREMLSMRINVTNTDETFTLNMMAFLRDPSKDSSEQGYASTAYLRTHKDEAREALYNEIKHIISFADRAYAAAVTLGLEYKVRRMTEVIKEAVEPVLKDLEKKPEPPKTPPPRRAGEQRRASA